LDLQGRVKAERKLALGVEIELVCLGQILLGTNTIAESGLNSDSIVYVFVHPEKAQAEQSATDFVFEFTGGSAAIPASDTVTVLEVKTTLQKKLLRALDEISVIDVTGQLLLQDSDKIKTYATGRSFWVVAVDKNRALSAEHKKVLARFAPPGMADDQKVLLFRQCDFRAPVFLTTVRKRFTAPRPS
jgi:hypothetical protein